MSGGTAARRRRRGGVCVMSRPVRAPPRAARARTTRHPRPLLNPDAAAVGRDEPARDREAEPGAAAAASVMERLEDLGRVIGLDARPLSSTRRMTSSPCRSARRITVGLRGRELQRVLDHVDECPLHLCRVGPDRWEIGRHLDAHAVAVAQARRARARPAHRPSRWPARAPPPPPEGVTDRARSRRIASSR